MTPRFEGRREKALSSARPAIGMSRRPPTIRDRSFHLTGK
jgi:hypothetical protein